jgi:hypothetical protein
MPQPDPPSFHLRLPPELKAKLQAAKGGNSLNAEIVQRLERSLAPDPALHLAQALRPFLANLSEHEQAKLVNLAAEAAEILSGHRSKKRRGRRLDPRL